jgi:stringent starvation protein B
VSNIRLPRRPYLLRAMVEWINDSGETPHVVVDATAAGVQVPAQFIRDGKIVLNIALAATQGLSIGNELLEFSARFGGAPFLVSVPMSAVLGVYSRETGEGMIFTEPDGDPGEGPDDKGPSKGPPKLTVVK